MKNKILTLFRNNIPYIKELRILAGSITASILMQQLDYWFEKSPGGFYKFLEPCENSKLYKKGDSWTEELGFSRSEFKTAFEKIGVSYKSKREFTEALKTGNLFQGKFYCCYIDRIKNITVYYRNHELLDLELEKLLDNTNKENILAIEQEFLFKKIDKVELRKNRDKDLKNKEENIKSVNEESSTPYAAKVKFDITETTTEKKNTDREKKAKVNSIEKVKDKLKDVLGQSVENPQILDSKVSKISALVVSLGLEKVLKTLDKIKENKFLMDLRKKKGDLNFLNYILGLEKFTDIAFGAHDPFKKDDTLSAEELKQCFKEEEDSWLT